MHCTTQNDTFGHYITQFMFLIFDIYRMLSKGIMMQTLQSLILLVK